MKRRFSWLWACAAWLLTLAGAAHGRETVAMLTMQSVPAMVVRGAAKFDTLEGVSLEPEDIVETMPFTQLTRVEFADGTIVDLGPASRVMIKPSFSSPSSPAGRAGSGTDPGAAGALIYLLDGWAKVSLGKPSMGGKLVLASSTVDVLSMAKGAVVHSHGNYAEVFAESGAVDVSVRGASGKASPLKLPSGAFMARQADGNTDTTARPLPAFVQSVPRPFMDTLPPRAARFKGQDLRLGTPGKLVYADVEAWLNAEPRVRMRFVQQWRPLAKDEAFRRGLMAQLPAHPEWRPVLMPPPSLHKPAPLPGSTSSPSMSAKPRE
jgi:hypothetical protein